MYAAFQTYRSGSPIRLSPVVVFVSLVFGALAPAQTNGEEPVIELQSGPLTPGLVLSESMRPIHQVRLFVDGSLKSGTLVLETNTPEFDEYGGLVGGIQTPQARGKGGPLPPVKLKCAIEYIKEDSAKWRLYRLSGPEIRTPLCIAASGFLGAGGPSRLIVLTPEKTVKAVVDCTRYGLVVP